MLFGKEFNKTGDGQFFVKMENCPFSVHMTVCVLMCTSRPLGLRFEGSKENHGKKLLLVVY